MACLHCGRDKPISGRGYCGACYSRLQRQGTLERTNAVNQGRVCKAEGCDHLAFAKGFCAQHYGKAQHPLRNVWKLLRSRARKGNYPEAWDNFDAFLADVGEAPSTRHQLRRIDPEKPYSRKNMKWQAPLYADGGTPEYHSEYSKAWNLKKSFGMTVEEYEAMLKAQGGVCAICKQAEKSNSKLKDRPRNLTVDHCHTGGHVRGLLCNRCNRFLGLARDNPDFLRSAIAYLDRHRPPSA